MRKLYLLILALLAAATLFAQSNANKAEISGTVFDPNQAVIPNAKVQVKNSGTGLTRELTTNELGQYRAVLLDPGQYELSAESSGFARSRIEGVVLNVGAALNVDIVLQVSSTTTTIEVGASLMNISLPAPSTTINTSAIANLPINGRRFQDFAVLTPTVQVDPQRGQLSFAGQRGINANVMLDGADYNQPFFGGIRGGERSNSVFTVPQSAIQEFQVITTGYSAEYGRSSGGVLNTITKSGVNEFHGDAFYQIRHKEMGSKDPVQRIGSLETLHQWGGSVGGPVQKEKLFFFAAVERQDSATPRQVLFAQLLNRTATAQTADAFNFFKSEEQNFRQTNDATAFTIRGDAQRSAGHRLTLRYNFSDAAANNAVSVGTAISPFTSRAISNDGSEKDRTHTGTAQYTHLFSPTILNDLRFTGTYELRPRLSNSATPQVSSLIGTFGARNFLPTTQNDLRLQISDALSITRSTHTLKIGFDYNRVTASQVFGFNQFGGFSIAGSNIDTLLRILSVAPGQNRFNDNSVTYSRQIGNLVASMSMHQAAAFVQDSWRVNQKLTLDFGFRWEGQYNPAAEASNTDLVNRVKGFRFPNGATLDPTTISDATKQVMPRFGFAWTPLSGSHRTVVRGHTGLFYAAAPLLVFTGPTNNFRLPPGDVSITLAPVGGQTVYQQLRAVGVDLNSTPLGSLPVVPIDTVQRASTLALGGTARDPFAGAALIMMPTDYANPRAFQAGLGFESEVARNLVAGAQFNLVNTVHLMRNRDYNLPAPFIRANDASQRPTYGLRTGTLRPIPTLSGITVRETSARSMFRSVTFSAQYRAKKLQFGGFYTWAQNYSDDDSERDATGFNYADPFHMKLDYGFARLDIRHQFTSYFVLSLPVGFDVSGSFRARGGLPVNATTGGDTNEEFGNNDRPFSGPGVPFARNSFRNRGVYGNDLRVLKNFPLGEGRRIQFSAEFFNLFNIDNVVFSGANGGLFGGVYGLGIGTNGQPVPIDPRFLRLRLPDGTYDRNNSQSGTPLQVQFGLRFFF
ncbi:MAG: TonB-dependent receptor [Acidimicrobiia bacterium]|nr:TonB-dependent receptor [Acidimicrobiia bacterium]